MAMVVITLIDTEGGTVSCECTSDPVFNRDALTDAQVSAINMLDSLVEQAGEIHYAKADGQDLNLGTEK